MSRINELAACTNQQIFALAWLSLSALLVVGLVVVYRWLFLFWDEITSEELMLRLTIAEKKEVASDSNAVATFCFWSVPVNANGSGATLLMYW